jgi:hypothetical protein
MKIKEEKEEEEELISFQNCFRVLSRLCKGKSNKTFNHFKHLRSNMAT